MADAPIGRRHRVRSLAACVLCAATLVAGYAATSFNPTAPLTATDEFDYRENESSDRQRSVTSRSVIGYLMLGLAGAAAFFAAPRGGRWSLPLLLGVGAYMLLCYASVLWSADASLTIRKLGVATLNLAAAIGFARLLGLRGVALMCALTAGTLVMIGLANELRLGTFRPWRSDFAFVGMGEKNGLAVTISFFIIAVLSLRDRGRQGLGLSVRRLAPLLLIAFAGVLLVVTKSRTGLASGVAAAMTGLFLHASGYARTQLLSLGAFGVGALLLVVGLAGADDLVEVFSLGRSEHVGQLTGRVPLWGYVLSDVAERPVLGHGFGGYWNAKTIDDISSTFYWQIHQAHSVYFDLLANLGVAGLITFVALLAGGMATAVGRYRSTGDPAYLFVASVIVMAFVNGLAESKFMGFGLAGFMLFCCLFGLVFDPLAAAAPAHRAAGSPMLRSRRGGPIDWAAPVSAGREGAT